MNDMQLKKDWNNFLIDIGKNGTEVAKENGQLQQTLNKKINNGTIKYLELSEIVEKYGYSIKIHKDVTQK